MDVNLKPSELAEYFTRSEVPINPKLTRASGFRNCQVCQRLIFWLGFLKGPDCIRSAFWLDLECLNSSLESRSGNHKHPVTNMGSSETKLHPFFQLLQNSQWEVEGMTPWVCFGWQ